MKFSFLKRLWIVPSILVLLFLLPTTATGQACGAGGCAFGGVQFPGGTFSSPGPAFTNVSTCIFAGEYQLYSVVAGNQYEWTYCATDGANDAGNDLQLNLFNNATTAAICYSDDVCGLDPRITWTATFTGTVRVLTSQFFCGTNTSCQTLRWREVAVGPPNDDCATAIPVACGSSVTGTTVGATADAIPGCGGSPSANGVWYSITGTGGNMSVNTCTAASYDTRIAVYTNTCAALTCVGDNDDFCGLQSQVTFASVAGQTYFVFVNGFGGQTGTFTLSVLGPTNEVCASAIPITAGSITGSTLCASNDTEVFCGTSDGTGGGVWYSYVGTGNSVNMQTCGGITNYDTKIRVFTGACGALACETGIDDACGLQSSVDFCGQSGVTYFVLVHGFSGAEGSFTLTTTETPVTVNITGPSTICTNETVTLTATAGGSAYLWSTGATTSSITEAPIVNTTYSVTMTDPSGCIGNTSQLVTVVPQPAQPTVNAPLDICDGANVILEATGSGTGDLVFYDNTMTEIGRSTMGGIPTQTFDNGVMAIGSYTFFVTEDNGTCESPASAINVTVNALPTAPSITGTTTICEGETTTLSVTTTNIVNWYSNAGLTNFLATGSSYTTAPLTTTTDFFTTEVDSNGCESAATQTTVTVNLLPADPVGTNDTICSGDTAVVMAVGAGGTLEWFDASMTAVLATGGSYTTMPLTQTTTYYVAETDGNGCMSNPVPVMAVVNPLPAAPSVATPLMVCEGDDVMLSGTGSGTGDLIFYDNTMAMIATVAMGGTPTQMHNAGALAAGSYTFYVTESDGTCESAMVAIDVTVNALPASPMTTDTAICSGSSVTLMATATGTVNWYGDAALTNLLATGSTYNTGALTATTNYFVTQVDTNGCESTDTNVVVTVNPLPADPVGTNDTICSGDTAVVMAVGAGGTLDWYDASMTTVLATGGSYTTMPLTQTTTYYVAETDGNGCMSNPVAVMAVVNPLPAAPSVATPLMVCEGNDVMLSGTGSGTGDLIFYDNTMAMIATVAMGGTPTQMHNAGALAAGSYTFYVTESDGTCESAMVAIDVTVNALPASPMTTDTAICDGSSVTLMATAIGMVNWYGDAALTNLLATGSTYNTGALTATTNYFVTQMDTNGCESTDTNVVVTVNPLPADPVGTNDTICSGDTAVVMAVGAGGTLDWYDASMTTVLATGGSYTTMPLTQTTTYYVAETDGNGCMSNPVAVMAVVNPLPAAPSVATPLMVCEGNDVMLSGTGSGTGDLIFYDNTMAMIATVAMGGTPTQMHNAGALAAGSYTFYVTESDGTCESAMVAIDVTVNALPASPMTTDTAICSGSSVTLMATATGTVNWYGDAALTNLLATGSTYNTGALTATTNYFVTQVDTNGCESTDTNVIVTVNLLPADPVGTNDTICSGDTAVVMAVGAGGTLEWYDASMTAVLATGGSYTTMPLTQTTTYYVTETDGNGCMSNPVAVMAVVNPLPAAPSVSTPLVYCDGDAVLISATGSGSGDLVFYDDTLAVIISLGMGGTPTQSYDNGPLPVGTYTFYVSESDGTCESDLVPVDVTVNALPVAPVVADTSVCDGGSVTLMATVTGDVNWYSDGGLSNLLMTGSSYTTPSLNVNTDYYVTQVGPNGCESLSDTVTVTVNPLPTDPVVSPDTVCVGSPALLTALGSGGAIQWYSDGAGVNLVATGDTFNTPNLSQTTDYYLMETDANGCMSNMVTATATVLPAPPAPGAVSPILACEGEDITLTASGTGTGDLIFYDGTMTPIDTVTMAGNPIGTSNLGVLAPGNYTYFVAEDNGICVSVVTSIGVQVSTAPSAPMVANATICEGETATLMTSSAGTINWYADTLLTNLLHVGNMFTSPALFADTSYFVTRDSGGCTSLIAQVDVTVNPAPLDPIGTNDTVCVGDSATIMAVGAGGTLEWFSDPAAMNLVFTGASFDVGIANQNTTYYVRETDGNGCVSSVVAVEVMVTPLPDAPVASGSEVCDGDDLVLTATGSGTGDLVFYDNADIEVGRFTMAVGTETGTINLGSMAVGLYAYTVVEDNGSCESASTGIEVRVLALPATPSATNDGPACEGDDVFLQAGPVTGGTFNWSGPNGFASNLQTVGLQAITAAEAGTYTVNVTVGACTSADTTTDVVVNALPIIDTIDTNGPLCEGDMLQLTGPTTANVTYEWTGPNGFTSTLQNPTITGVNESDHQGFYELVITDNTTGCASAMASTILMVTSLPTAGLALNSGPVCAGDSIELIVESVFGATYSWTGPNGFTSTDRTPTVYNMDSTKAGIYTVVVDVNGCNVTLTTNVIVRTAILTTVIPDTTIELGASLQLYATGGILFEWSPPDYLSNATVATPIFTPTQTGTFTYSVKITDVQGCSVSEKVNLTVIPSLNVTIPDLFTPNADGFNDTWVVDFLQSESNYTLQIFSRGGLEVYTSTDYQNDWDGTHYKSGKILPDGTYYYIIRLSDGTEFRGPVTIKR